MVQEKKSAMDKEIIQDWIRWIAKRDGKRLYVVREWVAENTGSSPNSVRHWFYGYRNPSGAAAMLLNALMEAHPIEEPSQPSTEKKKS